eukprot:CAMPEP_0170180076 /NCGR_PEP_ID=MMETSP0040_2-20121228/20397_1 /TAXON_ID=641309 /ORGANISM="Lotharella oceanica, Strain CCMP622" /LENGTH=129 /DNA_ID=CAMNT_0010424545 /DNA_START=603 /DNA_END=988 /DNA_ORIENTATION=-
MIFGVSVREAEAAVAQLASDELVTLLVAAPGQGTRGGLLLLALASFVFRDFFVPHVKDAPTCDVLVHLAIWGFVELEEDELPADGALGGRVLLCDVDGAPMVSLLSMLDAEDLRAVLAFEGQKIFRLAL